MIYSWKLINLSPYDLRLEYAINIENIDRHFEAFEVVQNTRVSRYVNIEWN